MAFSNGQLVQAADLNNFSVTTVTTTGDVTIGDDLAVTDDVTIGGDLAVTGGITMGGVPITSTVTKDICCGRLSLTTAVPVTSTDVTAATTLYWALYKGNQIALYNGSAWILFSLAQLSIAVPGTTNQMYDVFVDYNAGTPALSLTAWTNDTTRATALTTQDGVLVLTGTLGKRFVGCMRTTAVSGQTEDSAANRLVWNYYNRITRTLRVVEATNSWSYDTATWRQANGAATNQVAIINGLAGEAIIDLTLFGAANVNSNNAMGVGIGEDSTSAPSFPTGIGGATAGGTQNILSYQANLTKLPAVGYHYYAWLELGPNSGGTTTWYGDNGGTSLQTGMVGTLQG
jgi:hypothetical protein